MTDSKTRLVEIRDEIKKQDQASYSGVWLIGKLLSEAKDLTQRGDWEPYVIQEFGWSLSYSARLMKMYREYPDGLPEGVGISNLLLTLSLDEAIREQVNKIIAAAELSKAETEHLRDKLLKQDKKTAADKVNEALQSPENIEKLRSEIRAELLAEQVKKTPPPVAKSEDITELETANNSLKSQLKQAETRAKTAEAQATEAVSLSKKLETVNSALIEARSELSTAKDKLDTLSRQKGSKPSDPVKVEVIVEPADYQENKLKLAILEEINEKLNERVEQLLENENQVQPSPERKIERLERENHDLNKYIEYLENLLSAKSIQFSKRAA